MEDIKFYPCLTEELIDKCGCTPDKYTFSHFQEDTESGLLPKGSSTIRISDPLDIWNLSEDGITIKKKVSIAYPDFLYGSDGIACKNAEIGICILWKNHRLTQAGLIKPIKDITTATGRTCLFEHSFQPGEIDGDLELTLSMYIKSAATEILEGEEALMNEEGVSVGEIETISINFDSKYMEFPIEELRSASEPLWWIEFSQWEDPKSIEDFSKDNLCLYLNPYYPSCPMTDGNIKNIDLLVDILASAYFMMFQKLSEEDLTATRNDINLSPNSICSILHQFITECETTTELRFESPEKLMKSLQINMRARLTEEDS